MKAWIECSNCWKLHIFKDLNDMRQALSVKWRCQICSETLIWAGSSGEFPDGSIPVRHERDVV